MKKLIFSGVIAMGLMATAIAQKGSLLLYGNVNASAISNGGGGKFGINPGIGYQFNNSWTAGIEGGYNYYDQTYNGNIPAGSMFSSIVSTYQVGLFIRQAIPLSSIFAYYTQFGVGYQGIKNGTGGDALTANGVAAYLTPNIGVNLKNSFALNFGFGGLTYNTQKPSGGTATNTFALTFGQGFTFGISKNFGGVHIK
jgi:hypothetical protein